MFGIGLALSCTSSLYGQIRFQWPDTPVDVAQYRTIDECLAVSKRLQDSVQRTSPIIEDTTPVVKGDWVLRPLDPKAVAAAKRCSEKFTVENIDRDDVLVGVRLFLRARRFADVEQLIRRRLDMTTDTTLKERALVLDTIAMVVLREPPIHFPLVDWLIDEIVKLGDKSPWLHRGHVYSRFLEVAEGASDTVRMKRAAELFLALPNEISEKDKRSSEFTLSTPHFLMVEQTYNHALLMDSLRVSTEAYARTIQRFWERLTGEVGVSLKNPVGEDAPPIEGDWWFPKNAPKTVPVPGKINLIQFITPKCYAVTGCWGSLAVLRRLKQKFPDIQITLVAEETLGYIGTRVMDVEEEANTMAKLWLDYHRIPAILTVQKTEFWRLSEPDRRSINPETSNVKAYSFGGMTNAHLSLIIVDQKGKIVHKWTNGRYEEPKLVDIIKVLSERKS
jgi:hypothetical protein